MKRLLVGIIILLSVSRIFCEDAADKMVLVKGGMYTNPRGSGETKRVKLTDFYISAVQVTVGDYQTYLKETDPSSEYLNMEKLGRNYEQPVTVSFPMGYITWFDALEYCNWLSKKRGYRPVYEICAEKKKGNYLNDKADYPAGALVKWDKEADGYRLATVDEWEYAASARGTNFDYGSVKSPTVLDEAWLYENANFKFHPVGLKKPNALGLYDMLGNMFEWCWDLAETPEERKDYYRATKGSSCDTRIAQSSMLNRFSFYPLRIRYSTHGFRLVRSVAEVSKIRQGFFGSRYSAGKSVYATDNLNIRAAPNLRAEKVVLAAKGSPLTVFEEGKKETINGIAAPWIKVRLPDGKEGWCFAGYVAAKKIYKAVLDREEPIIKNPENGTKKLDSIDHLIIDNKVVRLGSTKPKGMISNIILEAPFMEFYKFGDIEGYENRDTIIGWNNMNAFIFITTVDSAARTQSGITIGSTREEVIRVYGEEYPATKNRIQYINSDFELVGMIFYFENNRVIGITCFTHI